MQYHVQFSAAPACTASDLNGGEGVRGTAASPSTSSAPATSSVAHCQATGRGSDIGVTVGQGLLSGRRIAVRVAPPPPSNATPIVHIPSNAGGGIGGGATHGHSDDRLSGGIHKNVSASCSSPAACDFPPSMANIASSSINASSAYGKGIVRISELRRQGVSSVESGLRLATLQGSLSVSASTSTHRGGAAHAGGSEDGGDFYGRSAVNVALSKRRTRQRVSPTRTATISASASSSTRTRGGRRGTSTSGGGRRRGRGSSGGSRASTVVALRDDGQLCDYRWFTARGRRCFVYDGRTYKGSSAHRMWEKVKEAARQRGLSQPPAVAASRTSASPRARGGADLNVRYSAEATRSTVSRAHQSSARARFAADQALTSQQEKRRSTAVSPALVDEATHAGALSPSRLPEEWRTLMGELGLMPDVDGGAMESSGEGCLVKVTAGTQPPVDAPSFRSARPPPQRDHLSAGSAVTEGVIEVSDSNSTRDDTATSDSDTSSSLSTAVSPAERNNDTGRGHCCASKLATSASLQWPATSYFSDASSEWSSTSSFTRSPARPPSSISSISPKRKRGKQELGTGQAVTIATSGAPARLRRYHGVQVVVHDGWAYPVDVYASQQQQQQSERKGEQVGRTVPDVDSRGATLATMKGNPVGASSDCTSAPRSVDDVPLADLYREAMGAQTHVAPAPQPFPPELVGVPLSSPKASAGLSIVSGSGTAVPVRPVAVSRVAQGNLLSNSIALRHSVSMGCTSSFSGADDRLDNFNTEDCAGMFVTGEEIGGFRYDG